MQDCGQATMNVEEETEKGVCRREECNGQLSATVFWTKWLETIWDEFDKLHAVETLEVIWTPVVEKLFLESISELTLSVWTPVVWNEFNPAHMCTFSFRHL